MSTDAAFQGPLFEPAEDFDQIQEVVLAAAIDGDNQCRARVAQLLSAFEEPYRQVAEVVADRLREGEYLDRNTVLPLLEGVPLRSYSLGGGFEQWQPQDLLDQIFATQAEPGQAAAYLDRLETRLRERRREEFLQRASALVDDLHRQPNRLSEEIQQLVAETRRHEGTVTERHPSEMLQLIPFMQQLEDRQRGLGFIGLDTGFEHYNYLCNGLDTGLTAIAGPPGAGKTTLLWQICCQVAYRARIPILFFSFEQSAEELRVKTLARLSGMDYRHILRGRLRPDDPATWQPILAAATEYFDLSRDLTIVEGDDSTTVDRMQEIASAKLAASDADRCLVAVDYLQVIPLREADAGKVPSAKDKIDLQCSALRRLARRLASPVVTISSQNRAGYGKKRQDVFKESGGIEYATDVGAVLTRNTDQSGDDYHAIDLNVIKNRNGERGVVKFQFYARRMEFVETGRGELPAEDDE